MEDLTKVTEEVVTETVEEVVTKVGFGTVLTGAFALTGVLAAVYGTVKVGKWAYGKVKAGRDNKVTKLEAEEANDDVTGVEEE